MKQISFMRYWRSLSSLQRSLVWLLLLCSCCFLFYIYQLYRQMLLEDIESIEKSNFFHIPTLAPLPKFHRVSFLPPIDSDVDNSNKLMKIKPWKTRKTSLSKGYIDPTRVFKNERMEAVIRATKHSWDSYKKFAWGRDELLPLTGGYSEWFGVGLTLIDSMDTLYIMGLKEDFNESLNWIREKLDFKGNKDVNLFECTIRILGGLLSAYHLSHEDVLLHKAKDLGDRLMAAFHSASPIPFSDVNLGLGTAHAPRWGPDSSLSEVTTIQLEFIDLARITKISRYEDAVMGVTKHIHGLPKKDGLVPIFINANTGQFRPSSTITVGARGDSYYEYLLKIYLQTANKIVLDDYVSAIEGMKKHLMKESEPNKLFFVGELLGGQSFSPKMDHLVCFLGGNLALASTLGLDYMEMGQKLTETCYQMYNKMPTGLSPEITYFHMVPGKNVSDLIVKPADSHNLQRPETIESLFYLYRLTKNKTYQDWGWKIFQAFEKHTRVKNGYVSIGNVKNVNNVQQRNKMESFWISETLKYFYLLFCDDFDFISLTDFVFNTEGHILPIYK